MALKTRGYAHRVDVAVTPAKVWAAMCGPTLMPLWVGSDARIRPYKGGHWSATIAPGIHREAVIDLFEPPRRLRLIYLSPPQLPVFDGAVVDDVLLEADGAGTIVRLLCSGMPELGEWTTYYAKVRMLAERSLARLKVLCEMRERTAQVSGSAAS
jgi:uncharacterized protein YndB with AHSA1/START domain